MFLRALLSQGRMQLAVMREINPPAFPVHPLRPYTSLSLRSQPQREQYKAIPAVNKGWTAPEIVDGPKAAEILKRSDIHLINPPAVASASDRSL